MKTLAIIPARGGSKRIPRKNLKEFCGKPIINYSVEAAQKAQCFDEIMVSTDDEAIAAHAKSINANVPFLRSAETSNDFASIMDVLIEVVSRYLDNGVQFEEVCCLLPTAPLMKSSDILLAKKLFLDNQFDSVFPAVRYSYPIFRALELRNHNAKMIWPENYSKRSQDLPIAGHDAGQFYWIRYEVCCKKGRVFTDNSGFIELPEIFAQDIDTEEDFLIAEFKYKWLKNKLLI